MEYVYAALLLHSAKQPINEENVKKVLQSAGIVVDDTKIKALVASLEGVNIDEAIQQATFVAATHVKEEAEEKKEEKKLEEATAGLSALFG